MSSTNEETQPWKVAAVVSFYMSAALVVSSQYSTMIACLINHVLQMVFVYVFFMSQLTVRRLYCHAATRLF